MWSRFNLGFSVIIGLVVGLVLAPGLRALLDCQITSTHNGHDQVLCSANPTDEDGIDTGTGNDTILIEQGAVVRSVGYTTALEAGYGHDTVENRGTVDAIGDGANLRSGDDIFYNYGIIRAIDDGIWCQPNAGVTCTVYNYAGAVIESTNEVIDVYSRGGRMVLHNHGRMVSSFQEGVHLHGTGTYEVYNSGYIQSSKPTIEPYGGPIHLENTGTLYSAHWMGVDADYFNDTIINYGVIQADESIGIDAFAGDDIIVNHGTIRTANRYNTDASIEAGEGNDTITTSGTVTEYGLGYAAIEAGHGSDTVIIQGGAITGLINGDHDMGTRDGDVDLLIFEFTGSTSQIAAFRTQITSQMAQQGSATWLGNTYTWRGFEEIRLNLTETSEPTPQPTPTLPPPCTGCLLATLGQPFKLPLAQQAAWDSEGIVINFVSVLEDSRCPRGEMCAVPGTVTVMLDIRAGRVEQQVTITLSDRGAAPVMVGPYTITLSDVTPHPDLNRPAANYSALVTVTR